MSGRLLLRATIEVTPDNTSTRLQLAEGLGFTDGLVLVGRAISALAWEQTSSLTCPLHRREVEELPSHPPAPIAEAEALLEAALTALGRAYSDQGARLSTADRPGLALTRATVIAQRTLGAGSREG
jgi:hypothetical protein